MKLIILILALIAIHLAISHLSEPSDTYVTLSVFTIAISIYGIYYSLKSPIDKLIKTIKKSWKTL